MLMLFMIFVARPDAHDVAGLLNGRMGRDVLHPSSLPPQLDLYAREDVDVAGGTTVRWMKPEPL